MKAKDLGPHFTHFLSLKIIDIYTFYPTPFISTYQKQNLLIIIIFFYSYWTRYKTCQCVFNPGMQSKKAKKA